MRALPEKMVNALLFPEVRFFSVDNVFEIFSQPALFHRLVLEAPATGRQEDIDQTGIPARAQRLFDAGNQIGRSRVEAVPGCDFQRVVSDFLSFLLVKDDRWIVSIVAVVVALS